MAETAHESPRRCRGETSTPEQLGNKLPENLAKDLISCVWGPDGPNRENLHRWSQGFAFSGGEPTALVQLHGGPCAVIAPVQAYLLKNALYPEPHLVDTSWRTKNAQRLLTAAFMEIFSLLNAPSYSLILPEDTIRIPSKRDATAMEEVNHADEENSEPHEEHGIHGSLRALRFASLDDLRQYLDANPAFFCSSYGVLRFLYSVIISKTIEAVRLDLEDVNEPLIDGAHGHGNQSLINFLITGSAVANVWDNEKDFGALRLKGIGIRPAVGFLSLLENMRYVEVGFFYKCPQFPIWILGSETHLSILFTLIPSLVTSEAEEAAAVRVFRKYDQHGSGFISVDNLGDVLGLLNLFKEDDYKSCVGLWDIIDEAVSPIIICNGFINSVNSLKQKLDKEHLGIILRSDFLAEFFPSTGKFYNGQQFDVYHYNGLPRSESPIRYHHGRAKILELDFDLEIINLGDSTDGIDSDSAIVRCLRTKYPRVEIIWDDNKIPSIN